MANGRCKRHGGKATGAKTPNIGPAVAASTKYGIYSKHFTDEDKAFLDGTRLGQVDDELALVRMRLNRTVAARLKWEQSLTTGDGADELILTERVEGDVPGKEGGTVDVAKDTFKLPNFDEIEHRLLARIESLEKTRKELMKTGEGDDDLPEGAETGRDHVTFTGGLDGGSDAPLPSPFAPGKK